MYPPKEDFHFPLPGNRKMPWTSNHFKLNFCLWVYRAVCILWIHCSDQNEMELVVTKSQGRFFFFFNASQSYGQNKSILSTTSFCRADYSTSTLCTEVVALEESRPFAGVSDLLSNLPEMPGLISCPLHIWPIKTISNL